MKRKDYSKWILNEVKETKTFTLLNVIGIWIGVWVVIVFLSLALGVEEAAINRITEDIDLFTLEVDPKTEDTPLYFSEFAALETDPRINQIVPVLIEFVKLGSYEAVTEIPQINENTHIIYTENYFSRDARAEDLRTDSLGFIEGHRLTNADDAGIIVSESTFKKLMATIPNLDRNNFANHRLAIIAERYNASGTEEYSKFECRIVGIADTTPYNGALVYISSTLAEQIDDWLKFRPQQPLDYRTRGYERFDLVSNGLADLESLHQELRDKDYPTSSILNRIDNVRQVLLVIKVVFFFIFGIAILISGFNIVITLTSSVLKRKHEIGILKSLGATDIQVLIIFVLHAVYLSTFGSILGAITAYIVIGLTRIILSNFEILNDVELFRTSILSVIFIIIFAILLSVIASFVPARRAASITPIETLREN